MAENTTTETKKEYRKASQLRVIWRRFRKHKAGLFGGAIFMIMFFLAIFADFIVPYEWERGAEALPDNGPTSASGEVIEGPTHLTPLFGLKAESREKGLSLYPETPTPDPAAE
jgi:ABC-type dipeptide/oligopeptide/nickel transport system permease subunit